MRILKLKTNAMENKNLEITESIVAELQAINDMNAHERIMLFISELVAEEDVDLSANSAA